MALSKLGREKETQRSDGATPTTNPKVTDSQPPGPPTGEEGSVRAPSDSRERPFASAEAPIAGRGLHPQAPIRDPDYHHHEWRAAATDLPRIRIQPGTQGGKPMIRNTRITVTQVLDLLGDLGSAEAVVAQFPGALEIDDVRQGLLFAARLSR